MIDKYYKKASLYIESRDVERAITLFISGLERGCHKCAYGIVRAVTSFGSYTMTDDEAISIFISSYPNIKLLAEEGDTEAMVMVAEGVRYGFVDDEEPYELWLNKASELGNEDADAILRELGLRDDWELPDEMYLALDSVLDFMDDTDRLLLDYHSKAEEELDDSDDHALIAELDDELSEQFGINLILKERQRSYELEKCRDDSTVV